MPSIAIPDQEITVIKTKATKGFNQASTLVIATNEDMPKASDLLGNIKTAAKIVDLKKKEITDPMNQAIKKVRELFAPIEKSLAEAESMVKTKMLDFQRELDRKAAEEMAAIEEKVTKQEMTFSEANQQAASIESAPKAVTSKKGTVSFREVQVVEVTNELLIPREYLAIDMVAVRKDALSGIFIPGVVVKFEKQVSGRY